MKKLRVLFLYPRTLDTETSVGGVAEFLLKITTELPRFDIEPIIFAGNKHQNAITGPTFLENNIPVYTGRFVKPGFFIFKKKLQPILKLCKELQIDLTHAQGTYSAGFLSLQIYKNLQIPYVVTSHSDILSKNSKRINRSNVQRRCRKILNFAHGVTHLTPMMETVSNKLFDTTGKNFLIGNGIKLDEWKNVWNLPERDYLLTLGRLEVGKGFDVLIKMYAQLLATGIETSLVIAGKGGAKKDLYSLTKSLGLNLVTEFSSVESLPKKSVIFTGYIRDEIKMQTIAQSKCILFATQPHLMEEAYGLVQLETIAAGKALLASDSSITQYLMSQGIKIIPVQADNCEAWKNKVYALLKNSSQRAELGKQNLQIAANFDWHPIARQYQDVYRRCLR